MEVHTSCLIITYTSEPLSSLKKIIMIILWITLDKISFKSASYYYHLSTPSSHRCKFLCLIEVIYWVYTIITSGPQNSYNVVATFMFQWWRRKKIRFINLIASPLKKFPRWHTIINLTLLVLKWDFPDKIYQCHGCWCLGSLRRQVINNNTIGCTW